MQASQQQCQYQQEQQAGREMQLCGGCAAATAASAAFTAVAVADPEHGLGRGGPVQRGGQQAAVSAARRRTGAVAERGQRHRPPQRGGQHGAAAVR
jgi:hypothetical protein